MSKRNATCVIVDDLPFKAPAGHTMYHRNADRQIVALAFGCPCGCGAHHGGSFTRPNNPWGFDGNIEKPTVTGSFGCYSEPTGPDGHYHWHGHLVAGEFVEC